MAGRKFSGPPATRVWPPWISTALVRAKADSGECTITATLADGTESIQCLVRVGDITVPIFATGSLAGQRANDNVSLADVAALKASTPDSILVDAGGSLHGTTVASMTGGMDMLQQLFRCRVRPAGLRGRGPGLRHLPPAQRRQYGKRSVAGCQPAGF